MRASLQLDLLSLPQFGDEDEAVMSTSTTRTSSSRGSSRSRCSAATVAMFDPLQDDWCEYIERLEHYFTANDIVSSEK
jgi:hypothetical protein